MKIKDQIISGASYPFQTTTVLDLPRTTQLCPESYIHMVQFISDGKYTSMKMRINDFTDKVYQSVNNTFKVDYWKLHNHFSPATDGNVDKDEDKEAYSFVEMIKYLDKDAPQRIDFTSSNFVEHINYDFAVIRRYIVKKDNEILGKIDGIKSRVNDLECMFDSNMTITTTDHLGENVINESVNHKKSENDNVCQLSIQNGNKISGTWTVPETGNLVIYGWLDSSNALNNKAIPSSYCVIEAKMNNIDSTNDNWEIIGVQSVIPAKTITYVGFTLPVKKGLEIRARTGFTVGAKSGQYSNEQDGYDTLSNSTPNGFKCQVFSNIRKENI